MAKGAIIASTTVSFDDGTTGQGIRLVEDNDREVEPTSRSTPQHLTVSCTNKKYVRLYPPRTPTTKVIAATGGLALVGSGVEYDAVDVATFSPDSKVHEMPRGVENVRIELVGTAFSAEGDVLPAKVTYDAVRREVKISESCYCVVKVKYDAPYSLYLYTFSGECPDVPVSKFDANGNPIGPLSAAAVVKYFEEGLISAIDPAFGAYTTLSLTPPDCAWTGVSVNFADSDKDKVVPTLKMEIDPDYPPRLVSAGEAPTAECCIRIYPAGAATSVVTTSGVASRTDGFVGTRQVAEVKQFTNSAVAALDYPPAGSIRASVIGEAAYLGSSSGGGYIRGPGEVVTDVTYLPEGNGRYTNPRPRRLGSNEIAMVDLFGHPVPCHGIVQVDYSSLYDRYVFTFSSQGGTEGGMDFISAFIVASDALGRASSLKVDPPSLKDKTKSMR